LEDTIYDEYVIVVGSPRSELRTNESVVRFGNPIYPKYFLPVLRGGKLVELACIGYTPNWQMFMQIVASSSDGSREV